MATRFRYWMQTCGNRWFLIGIPVLLGVNLAWGGKEARAAGIAPPPRNPAPALQNPATKQEGKESPAPGAAALLDAGPLQVGLKEQGLPEPLPAASPAAAPAATPPAPGAPSTPARLLVLDRSHRLLLVMENGRELRRFPVAVGMPGWETPVGQFTVIEKRADPTWEHPASGQLLPPGPENPLGSRWIGFYRDCRGRRGFNGKEHLEVKGCVTAGFHGTPNRSSVGQAVSHGCVRLFDEHAKELFDLVSLGTPVKVLP